MATRVEYLPGTLVRDSSALGFYWGSSHRHPLPSTYQNSRLAEGKQVFSISHTVCTNSLGLVNPTLTSSGNGGNPPEIQVPSCQPRPTLQAGLSKEGTQACYVNFFVCVCGILVPRPGIEPRPLAVRVQNPNHWTTREVLLC